jgi:Kef-type K+ transport system membrane component KefB
MVANVELIVTLSLIIIFSPFFAKVLHLPTTPIEIVFGSVFGYIGFLHHQHLFEIVAEFGFLYLMFIAGTEIDLKQVLRTPIKLVKMSAGYIFALYAIAIGITLYFSLGKIFMTLLPLISVGLVAALAKEYGKQEWLNLSMTVGGIGEVVSIAMLTLVSAGLEHGLSRGLFETILSLIVFLLFMLLLFKALQLLFWWFPEVSTVLMPHKDNKEQDIRLSMGIFFILVGAMLYLHLELAFGAFLAGIFLPTFFDHKHELPEKLSSYGFGFLIPIFFIYTGSSFDLHMLLSNELLTTSLLITVAMIGMRMFASLAFAKEYGFKNAILLGLSHSMPLTLLVAMATLAYNAHSMDKIYYDSFILSSLLQVLFVMIVIKLIQKYTPQAIQPES